MTTFDKREEGFEKKFAHDEELQFKAMPAATSCSGCGPPEKLGKTGADADAYAKEVVLADFEEAGDDDVFRKVVKDLDAKGVDRQPMSSRKHERIAGPGHRADQDRQVTRHSRTAR